jgi:hypothetical protein
VIGAGGIKELNSIGDSFYLATSVTANTITINQTNSLQYTAYTSGGVIEYNQPVPLGSYSARMQIRETVESTEVLYSGTSTLGGHLFVDNTAKTIRVRIPSEVTAAFNFTTAVYSIELYEPSGLVIPFLTGNLTLVPEVTR